MIAWQGTQEPSTRLCILSLNTRTPPDNILVHKNTAGTRYDGNAYHITSKEDLIRYLNQFLFYPHKQTRISAIQSIQLTRWTGLTAPSVDKYLPDISPASDKVQMKR